MKTDVLMFFAFIAFFFVLWLAGGGPTRPMSFAGPYITPITDVDTVQQGYGEVTAEGISPDGNIWGDIMGGSFFGGGGTNLSQINNPSPLRGSVTVTGTGGVSATDPDQEYITIRASGNAPVTITGWRIESGASRRSVRIPEGTPVPRSGRVNDTEPIVLQPGDEAIITTGESPIGVSFRENRCTGYLAQRQTFNPSLQTLCPSPMEEFDRRYTGNKLRDDSCYNLMQSTQICRTPRESRSLSSACLGLIDNYLSYNGCVDTYRNEPGFAGTTWRIYLEYERNDRDSEFWKPTRDSVKLLDTEGKTVDVFTY